MSSSRFLLVVLSALAPTFVMACSAESDDDSASTSEASSEIVAAKDDFLATLREVESLKERCTTEGKCRDKTASARTATLQPNLQPLTAQPRLPATKNLIAYTLCEAIRPLAALEAPYFFAGVNAKAAAVATLVDGGIDIVFDLRNEQAALFHYHQHGYQNAIGVEATAYAGWAFGAKHSVIEAWSGTFQTAEATIEVPFIKLSVGGSIFRSPDNSLWGAAAEASIGLNALGPLAELSVSEGEWTAWDGATKGYADSLWFVDYTLSSDRYEGKSHTYVQFSKTRDLALALVETFGVLGVVPAVQAVALGALRSKKLTIERACPKN